MSWHNSLKSFECVLSISLPFRIFFSSKIPEKSLWYTLTSVPSSLCYFILVNIGSYVLPSLTDTITATNSVSTTYGYSLFSSPSYS